jgi:hypothetical protein
LVSQQKKLPPPSLCVFSQAVFSCSPNNPSQVAFETEIEKKRSRFIFIFAV